MLSETNPETLELIDYRFDISVACAEIEKLRDAQSPKTKAYDYYNTIYQTLCTLDCVFHEMQSYKRMVNITAQRIDILEKFILATDKNKMVTFDIIDKNKCSN